MEIFKLTEKAESKYRPVATISQIEISSHAPVVLVGECLPQTLLIFRDSRDLRLRRTIHSSKEELVKQQGGTMTKPSIRSTRHKTQHSGTPRKTKLIKFRVTEQEKLELELLCKLLRVNMSTLIRRSLLSQPIKQILVVTGSGEEALNILSDLLGQCGKIGSNLNQLARHFNSGGKDSEQIRAQLLTELSALTLFRLDAEKKMGELYGNHQAYKLEELRSNSA